MDCDPSRLERNGSGGGRELGEEKKKKRRLLYYVKKRRRRRSTSSSPSSFPEGASSSAFLLFFFLLPPSSSSSSPSFLARFPPLLPRPFSSDDDVDVPPSSSTCPSSLDRQPHRKRQATRDILSGTAGAKATATPHAFPKVPGTFPSPNPLPPKKLASFSPRAPLWAGNNPTGDVATKGDHHHHHV